ncbi:hypothetical protein DNTS_011908 [Danionella cerebrum]|uniref:Calcitonin peptide-like domain-containing protein n=1 Tax=Danionella cerebrum TaxID=2873325 RepID=A0A553Q7I1_9TELE|nr:hypothetical protein DNTS_011908 [Danionella translucida]
MQFLQYPHVSELLSLHSVSAQKRGCNTATCVTHRLADLLSRSGGISSPRFRPTDVGATGFGRRRRKRRGEAETTLAALVWLTLLGNGTDSSRNIMLHLTLSYLRALTLLSLPSTAQLGGGGSVSL